MNRKTFKLPLLTNNKMRANSPQLTPQQAAVLELVIQNNAIQISYRKPQKQLGDLVENYDTTIAALRELEGLHALKLVPKGRRSYYEVNSEVAQDIYQAYQNSEKVGHKD